jgi:hypothetical protein
MVKRLCVRVTVAECTSFEIIRLHSAYCVMTQVQMRGLPKIMFEKQVIRIRNRVT